MGRAYDVGDVCIQGRNAIGSPAARHARERPPGQPFHAHQPRHVHVLFSIHPPLLRRLPTPTNTTNKRKDEETGRGRPRGWGSMHAEPEMRGEGTAGTMADASQWMHMALDQAEIALNTEEVPVGCVIVRNNSLVIAKGHNNTVATGNATRHAELEALASLFRDGQTVPAFSDCTLYVTVEPCVMCACALRQIGLVDVVFGCFNDKFGGCGSVLRVHDSAIGGPALRTRGGICKDEAIRLLQRFYSHENRHSPAPNKRTRGQAAHAASPADGEAPGCKRGQPHDTGAGPSA